MVESIIVKEKIDAFPRTSEFKNCRDKMDIVSAINLVSCKQKAYCIFRNPYPVKLSFKVKKLAGRRYFGRLDIDQGVKDFLHKHVESDNLEECEQQVKNTIWHIVDASGYPDATVDIRTRAPNDGWDKYDIPRFHHDAQFYDRKDDVLKYIVVFKGPGTIFCDCTFNDLKAAEDKASNLYPNATYLELRFRERIDFVLKDFTRTQIPPDHGAVYVSRSTVHSEPPINCERLYLAVLPGTSDEIDKFKKKQSQPKDGDR